MSGRASVVCDASAVVAALTDTSDRGPRCREVMRRARRLHAPHLLDAEVLSALRGLRRADAVDSATAAAAIGGLRDLRLRRHAHTGLVEAAWRLRENVTMYDGMYIALAAVLDLSLLTTDGRLARGASAHCDIELVA